MLPKHISPIILFFTVFDKVSLYVEESVTNILCVKFVYGKRVYAHCIIVPKLNLTEQSTLQL